MLTTWFRGELIQTVGQMLAKKGTEPNVNQEDGERA